MTSQVIKKLIIDGTNPIGAVTTGRASIPPPMAVPEIKRIAPKALVTNEDFWRN